MFFNVPTNGPGAILMARTGQVAKARFLVDWVNDELIGPWVGDGWHSHVHGWAGSGEKPASCTSGVMMGACLLTLWLGIAGNLRGFHGLPGACVVCCMRWRKTHVRTDGGD